MKKLREGYEAVPLLLLLGQDEEFLTALGFTGESLCTMCYERDSGDVCDPCLVGSKNVVVPAHIATIIKINATKGENHD